MRFCFHCLFAGGMCGPHWREFWRRRDADWREPTSSSASPRLRVDFPVPGTLMRWLTFHRAIN
jgi:hypothetical protein